MLSMKERVIGIRQHLIKYRHHISWHYDSIDSIFLFNSIISCNS